ncbi:MBL fold metallo-hydrolase [Aneurinibacillus tyrosinisolvens]|jgi:glyoxylase-like metal-dependent hydrolase (beta-lactamase superfamily II)/ferredoxin|uniref:MBL fold metallo-hydrolase n=1 Tax=Aneurinibacillus tyrosinisolvens TaxID=1443435 RepID=UPI00063F8969|nr:MBL fold metallo-hydrolase [Aneurinibacillus tyrosinisolvens]
MDANRRLNTNVPGNYYVTSSCINCDQCRQLSPDVFAEVGHASAVVKQPETAGEARQAFHALFACPTGAIGSENKEGLQAAGQDFPLPIAEEVYYCGFTSRHSYGSSSYLIVHPEGNWMVDAPRWAPQLAKRIEEMGGIQYILLTHRDDVADAEKYAAKFGAQRIIHVLEKSAQPDAEHLIEGTELVEWQPDFRIIPVPGHTRGHIALQYREKFLFTGDHLAWDRIAGALDADEEYCWYSFSVQTESMERLAQERFEWILPGHGDRIFLPEPEMKQAMNELVARMKS